MSKANEIILKTSIGNVKKIGDLLEIIPFQDKVIDFDLDAALQLIRDCTELTKGEPHMVLWDARDIEIVIGPEVRDEFIKSEEARKYRKALAFVVNSLPNRLTANFFVNVNKPPAPSAVFETREEAVIFLKKHWD